MITNKQKALIHVAKSQMELSDDEYRDLLGRFGAMSCKDLTQAKFDEIMRHFKILGFRLRQNTLPIKTKKARSQVPGDKAKMMGKIEAIILDLRLTWGYVDGMARNMFGVDVVSWCDSRQLHGIVAALEYHKKRQKKKANGSV